MRAGLAHSAATAQITLSSVLHSGWLLLWPWTSPYKCRLHHHNHQLAVFKLFEVICYCYRHFISSLNQTRVLVWKWIPISVTILSIQINTEYLDYRQCCNLRAAVPWRCRWCGRVYADRGHTVYRAGQTVCQVVSYPQARSVACNIVLAAADHRVYALKTVRLWSQCTIISVPDTTHHTKICVWDNTNFGLRHSTPHTSVGPRHSTPHTNMRLRQRHTPFLVRDTAHHTPVSVRDTAHHTPLSVRDTAHHTPVSFRGTAHHTPVSVRDTVQHTPVSARDSTPHTSFGPNMAHQSITFSTMQWFLIVSRHPQMCVLWVHQPLDQTTFTCTPSVIQNHSTNITWSHQAKNACLSLHTRMNHQQWHVALYTYWQLFATSIKALSTENSSECETAATVTISVLPTYRLHWFPP
jgi:hypothetical protein